jgi:hypothetical protein
MENYGLLIGAFLILIFIGLIHRKSIAPITKEKAKGDENEKAERKGEKEKESFGPREPPHLLRRLGLSPPNCPFRDQY